MSKSLYQTLPPPPSKISSGAVLSRFIDGIGFRYQMATNGFTENEINFRPVEGSMNMMEMLDHIYKVLGWAYRTFDPNGIRHSDLSSYENYRNATLEICDAFSKKLLTMSDEEIENISVYLKRTNTTYSVFYMMNGPIADVLTHVGQVISWRRIAGNPVARVSPFTGKTF